MLESKQKKIVLSGGAFLIAILLFVIILQTKHENNKPSSSGPVPSYSQKDETGSDVEITMPQWEADEFRQPVPTGVAVPEAGEKVPEELKDIVAVPHDVLPPQSGNSSEPSVRRFEIKGEANKFVPLQIIVKYNDIVDISILAIDKNYDIVLQGYNMKKNIAQGEMGKLSFQANLEGRFKFYCESCGGINSSASGEIIVVR